jgi:hypothetical protein
MSRHMYQIVEQNSFLVTPDLSCNHLIDEKVLVIINNIVVNSSFLNEINHGKTIAIIEIPGRSIPLTIISNFQMLILHPSFKLSLNYKEKFAIAKIKKKSLAILELNDDENGIEGGYYTLC